MRDALRRDLKDGIDKDEWFNEAVQIRLQDDVQTREELADK